MKKVLLMIIAVATIVLCTACSSAELKHDENLGYDFSNVKHSDITFHVYHTNTEDGSWEKIASFPCTPETGHYYDVKLVGRSNQVVAELSDNTYTESKDGSTISYGGDAIASYEYPMDGFEGNLPGWELFPIKDMEGEQIVRLYPISNSGALTFRPDVSLDKPYDKEKELDTIDNLLITIEMK